jgi:hypothetical protein
MASGRGGVCVECPGLVEAGVEGFDFFLAMVEWWAYDFWH